ncbi:hypothetical protein Drorol1_Dr00005989 [Drosera rotundifolia]
MERRSSRSKPTQSPSPPPAPQRRGKVFGGSNSVALSELDASKLIGSIIEKGIDEKSGPFSPSSAPRPSGVPFPVARHRSHGPYWAPNIGKGHNAGRDDDDSDYEEENDTTNYEPIADFANPIMRKKKKGLDLRAWRELVPASIFPDSYKTDEDINPHSGMLKSTVNAEAMDICDVNEDSFKPSLAAETGRSYVSEPLSIDEEGNDFQSYGGSVGDMDLDGLDLPCTTSANNNYCSRSSDRTLFDSASFGGNKSRNAHVDDMDGKMEDDDSSHKSFMSEAKPSLSIFRSYPSDGGCQSLEGQIDSENKAVLQKMSADEIAEAQAEIRNKMNPKLLEVLKRRGQEKLGKKDSSLGIAAKKGLDSDGTPVDKHLNQDEKGPEVLESNTSHSPLNASQTIESRLDRGTAQNSPQSGGHLWNAWSKRVEAVRDLRFSLNGDVVRTDFGSISKPGETSDQSGYSVEKVGERDFVRTEGDPGAAGYTIREAVSLTRSVFPAQRAFALHLLSSVLNNALIEISKTQVGSSMMATNTTKDFVDWEAIWAFALGPEPEFVLSLRMALDDNHNIVIFGCVKAIECILASDVNENFFDISMRVPGHLKELYTGPVFRTRPEISLGFLHGGFWKYSAKPSNVLIVDEEFSEESTEGGRTIQDDNVVASQDIAAGLVRMGVLPRLCSLLETDPTLALEESILSILIAVARASPACSTAISKFQRLVDVVVERFLLQKNPNVLSTRLKSVMLLRVLAQSDQELCMQFIKGGTFQKVTWQLYSITSSIDRWVKSGREHCKLSSKLMIEQLRLWRVCINYGHCVSYFTAFFPTLCLWLSLPRLEPLVEKNLLDEFCSVSSEAYFVLEALSRRLPNLHTQQSMMNHSQDTCGDGGETWCWNDVSPMVDLALKWIAFSRDSSLSKAFDLQTKTDGRSFSGDHVNSLLWVISAVLRFLSTIVMKASPNDSLDNGESFGIRKPLPQFVSDIGYQIVKNGFLSFAYGSIEKCSTEANGVGSFVDKLCYLRSLSNHVTALASVCCLHEIFQLLVSIDLSTQLSSECVDQHFSFRSLDSSVEGRIIKDGVIKCSLPPWKAVLLQCMKLVVTEWHQIQSIEVFGRGGPAPGVGLGWGASGGGFWSITVSLAQADASFLVDLLHTVTDSAWDEGLLQGERTVCKQMIFSALAVCLIAGPGDAGVVKKAFDFLLQIRVLKYLNVSIRQFLQDSPGFKQLNLEYGDEDLVQFSELLASHYSKRWLCVKQRKPKETGNGIPGHKTLQESSGSLDTIPEDTSAVARDAPASLAAEWAHQRLPLSKHWLLSPLTTLGQSKDGSSVSTSRKPLAAHDSAEVLEVIKSGLFFLLGIEILSAFMSGEDLFLVHSLVISIPLVWKLHSLSVMLLSGMSVLEDERNRSAYGALQFLYGRQLDESRLNHSNNMDLLRFQSQIHETYSTLFIDALVEQFASESFGDLHYGRQITIYLHRLVESPVRLAMWNALSSSRVLELLPPLDKCVGDAVGYLEPAEEEDDILQAYAKSWASGALDKAVTRGSMSYTLALHHLSSFVFKVSSEERRPLWNKIVKSLLRDYSRKQQRQVMMLDLIRYRADSTLQKLGQNKCMHLDNDELNRRLEILAESCDRDSSLLNEVEKLKSLLHPQLS